MSKVNITHEDFWRKFEGQRGDIWRIVGFVPHQDAPVLVQLVEAKCDAVKRVPHNAGDIQFLTKEGRWDNKAPLDSPVNFKKWVD